jgi:hypothetical protein
MALNRALVSLAEDIADHAADAKPLFQSYSLYSMAMLASGWTATNLVAYFDLDQGLATTIATGIVGLLSFLFGVIATMRRKGIRVPDWLADIAERFIEDVEHQELHTGQPDDDNSRSSP